jgi:hypothetical protein
MALADIFRGFLACLSWHSGVPDPLFLPRPFSREGKGHLSAVLPPPLSGLCSRCSSAPATIRIVLSLQFCLRRYPDCSRCSSASATIRIVLSLHYPLRRYPNCAIVAVLPPPLSRLCSRCSSAPATIRIVLSLQFCLRRYPDCALVAVLPPPVSGLCYCCSSAPATIRIVLSLEFCLRRYPDCAIVAVLPPPLSGLCFPCSSDWDVALPPSKPCIHSSGEAVHCTENPIYVFPEMKLRGRVPNSDIHVSVRD